MPLPALSKVPKMPRHYRAAIKVVCERTVMPALMRTVERQPSQRDIVEAVLDPDLWPVYHQLPRLVEPSAYCTNRFYIDDATFRVTLPYKLLNVTHILPTCPDEVYRRITAYAKDTLAVSYEVGSVYAVFEALDNLCDSASQLRWLFPQVGTLMGHDGGLDGEFAPVLERFDKYTRPKHMPLISPDLRYAISAAKATVAKWLLLKDDNDAQLDSRRIMMLREAPPKQVSWGVIPGLSE